MLCEKNVRIVACAVFALVTMLTVMAGPASAGFYYSGAIGSWEGYFNGACKSDDLINSGQSTLQSIEIDNPANCLYGSSIAEINNGTLYNGGHNTTRTNSFTPADGTVLTITLNTALHPYGYDISNLRFFLGDSDPYFTREKISAEYSTVGSSEFSEAWPDWQIGPADYVEQSVEYYPVGVTPPVVNGVDQFRMTFHNHTIGNAGCYREIDMFGTPTAAPEPSAIVLCVLGSLSLLAYAWRKRR
jgi:hypothetical protein